MWLKLDDGFATHPKILRAGPYATVLQIRAMCYAAQNKTDGFLPLAVIPMFITDLEDFDIPKWCHQMCEANLWEVCDGGYQIHDYLQWNMSREEYHIMKAKLSKAGKKGMKSRWRKNNTGYKVGNKVSDNLPHNPAITGQSTSIDTLSSLHSSDSPDLKSTDHSRTNGRDYREEAKVILEFLNTKTGKHFREIEVNLHFIEARLKSGVDLQTCKSLIARKVREWLLDPKMKKYLRPETLFNQTKFESYLGEVSS